VNLRDHWKKESGEKKKGRIVWPGSLNLHSRSRIRDKGGRLKKKSSGGKGDKFLGSLRSSILRHARTDELQLQRGLVRKKRATEGRERGIQICPSFKSVPWLLDELQASEGKRETTGGGGG